MKVLNGGSAKEDWTKQLAIASNTISTRVLSASLKEVHFQP